MNTVCINKLTIGEGQPKICVPIVGSTKQQILKEANELLCLPVDLVEWRVDWFDKVFDQDAVLEVAKELRGALGEKPILFTFRRLEEGGEKAISLAEYEKLNIVLAKSGLVDLIDLELTAGEEIIEKMVHAVHKENGKVIISNHDFVKTPNKQEILDRLCKMQELGADISKIAVMPNDPRDVLVLLDATLEMKEKYAKNPIVTMSMKNEGIVSRLAGEVFGSAITFGAAKKASAPGQVPVEILANIIKLIHS